MHFVNKYMKKGLDKYTSGTSQETIEFVDDYAYNVIFSARLETKETFNGILIKICNLCEI
jgi:hypothetical protein